jgi:hypothetical protein
MVAMALAERLGKVSSRGGGYVVQGGYIVWGRADCCRLPARCNLVYVVN